MGCFAWLLSGAIAGRYGVKKNRESLSLLTSVLRIYLGQLFDTKHQQMEKEMKSNAKRWLFYLLFSTIYCATAFGQSELTFEQTIVEGEIGGGLTARSYAVAEDSQGSIYIAGLKGVFPTGPNNPPSSSQAFLAKFFKDLDGNLTREWIDEFGTAQNNVGLSIAIDQNDNVFVGGRSDLQFIGSFAFLRKYPANSNVASWEEEHMGTLGGSRVGVATDSLGNVYLTGTEGSTNQNPPPPNVAFLECFRDDVIQPTLAWTTRIDTGSTMSNDVAVDADDSIYIVGTTDDYLGDDPKGMSAGGDDVYVAKFEDLGTESVRLFTEQIGTAQDDFGNAIATGLSIQNEIVVYIGGSSDGGLGGNGGSLGLTDAFLAKFDAMGTLQWDEQFGSDEIDLGNDVATDNSGNVYLVGTTMAGGATAYDAFIANYRDNSNPPIIQDSVQLHNVAEFPPSHITEADFGRGVSVRTPGFVYVAGWTYGKDHPPILDLAWLSEFSVPLLGDVNCDGFVNLLDVNPFVDLLTNSGYSAKADINGDGAVNLLDVQLFVDLIN